MNWADVMAEPERTPSLNLPPDPTLVATNSFIGHTSPIFAFSFDPIRDELISSGKDSQVITWNKNGQVCARARERASES